MAEVLRDIRGRRCSSIAEALYPFDMQINFFDHNVNNGEKTFFQAKEAAYNIKFEINFADKKKFWQDEDTDFLFYWNESWRKFVCYRSDWIGLLVTLTWWEIPTWQANYIALTSFKDPKKLEGNLERFKARYNPLNILNGCLVKVVRPFETLDEFANHYNVSKSMLLERLSRGWMLQDAVGVRKDFSESMEDLNFNIKVYDSNNRYKNIYRLAKALSINIDRFADNANRLQFTEALRLGQKDYTESRFWSENSQRFVWKPDIFERGKPYWIDYNGQVFSSLDKMCKEHGIDEMTFLAWQQAGADKDYILGKNVWQYYDVTQHPIYQLYFWENPKYNAQQRWSKRIVKPTGFWVTDPPLKAEPKKPAETRPVRMHHV